MNDALTLLTRHLPIASWYLAAALAALASATGIAGWRRRLLLVPTAMLVAVAILTGFNAWFDAYPHLDSFSPTSGFPVVRTSTPVPVGAATKGAIDSLAIAGRASSFGTHNAYVYLPPQYFTQPTRRFPVLELLHGSPGRPADWLAGGRAATAGRRSADLGRPIIILMPRASRSWLNDSECVNGHSGQLETYLSIDVIRAAQASLRTLPGRRHWAVGGMSAGGFCALNLGLRHRGTYSDILDMSGFTHPTHKGGMPNLFGPGATGVQAAAANDPENYVPTLNATPATHVDLVVGKQDPRPRREILAIAPQLRARGLDVDLQLLRGHHTYRVWAPALNDLLPTIAGRLS